MSSRKLPPDDEFVRLYTTVGPSKIAQIYGVNLRTVNSCRDRLEDRIGHKIVAGTVQTYQPQAQSKKVRHHWKIKDGLVFVFSDAHYWPGDISTAHCALVHFCKTLSPTGIVANGDIFDGASASRHPKIDWSHVPSIQEELEACQERMSEIDKACPSAWKAWTLGNHDLRFEAKMVNLAPEYAGVKGTALHEHFDPSWVHCMSLWINDDVVIKHRFKGGIHATHNNAVWSGKTMVTGHLHSQKVTPFNDYNGTRWGVDAGCLAEPRSKPFDYTEDAPLNWRSGFAVLSFVDGMLLQPEVVRVVKEGVVDFRGELIEVPFVDSSSN